VRAVPAAGAAPTRRAGGARGPGALGSRSPARRPRPAASPRARAPAAAPPARRDLGGWPFRARPQFPPSEGVCARECVCWRAGRTGAAPAADVTRAWASGRRSGPWGRRSGRAGVAGYAASRRGAPGTVVPSIFSTHPKIPPDKHKQTQPQAKCPGPPKNLSSCGQCSSSRAPPQFAQNTGPERARRWPRDAQRARAAGVQTAPRPSASPPGHALFSLAGGRAGGGGGEGSWAWRQSPLPPIPQGTLTQCQMNAGDGPQWPGSCHREWGGHSLPAGPKQWGSGAPDRGAGPGTGRDEKARLEGCA
jgi:hypothetical protein